MRIAAGVLIAFHGLVHAMYIGQALRWFELREGMTWPLGARLLTALSDTALEVSAAVTVGITSLGLIVGGVGIALGASWGVSLTLVAAAAAAVVQVLLWNGDWRTFPDQGLYGIVIDVVIVMWILAARIVT